jgi:hypothetical protein
MSKFLKIIKKIKLRNLIILVVLLAFNTYAWFIYTTKVSLDLTAHVSAWDVEFVSKEGGITSNMLIEVERVCPGMDNFEKIIEVNNRGEVGATLSYEIESLKIMGNTLEVSETSGLTSEDIENKMKTEYPFKINIEKDDEGLVSGTGNGSFRITVEWPFESGDDAKDTEWGNRAYEYYSLHPGENCIELKLILKATQKNS